MTGDHTSSAWARAHGGGSRPPELYSPHDDDPRTVGVYRIAGRLGAGWSGVVYGGLDLDGQSVAVKIVRPEHAQDSAFRADFPHDVERLRRVSGVCTTPVLAADPHAGSPWVATRYAPGRTLNEHLRELGPLSGDSLLSFASGLAEALSAFHAAGMAHRDVKPDNAVLTADGPVLVDFGLATAGRPVGRSGWVFPEGYAGATPGPEADVFGWACVVATAATGRPPFGSGTAKELRHRVLNSDPDLAGVPDALRFTLRWALAKDPEDRPHASTVLRTLLSEINDANPSTAAAPDARLRALLARDWEDIAPRPHDPRQWALASEDPDSVDDLDTETPGMTSDAATTGVNTAPRRSGAGALEDSSSTEEPDRDAATAFTRSEPSGAGGATDTDTDTDTDENHRTSAPRRDTLAAASAGAVSHSATDDRDRAENDGRDGGVAEAKPSARPSADADTATRRGSSESSGTAVHTPPAGDAATTGVNTAPRRSGAGAAGDSPSTEEPDTDATTAFTRSGPSHAGSDGAEDNGRDGGVPESQPGTRPSADAASTGANTAPRRSDPTGTTPTAGERDSAPAPPLSSSAPATSPSDAGTSAASGGASRDADVTGVFGADAVGTGSAASADGDPESGGADALSPTGTPVPGTVGGHPSPGDADSDVTSAFARSPRPSPEDSAHDQGRGGGTPAARPPAAGDTEAATPDTHNRDADTTDGAEGDRTATSRRDESPPTDDAGITGLFSTAVTTSARDGGTAEDGLVPEATPGSGGDAAVAGVNSAPTGTDHSADAGSAAASAPSSRPEGGSTPRRRRPRVVGAVLAAVLALVLVGGGYALYRVLPLGSSDEEDPVAAGGGDPDSDERAPASPGSEREEESPASDTSPPEGDASAEGEDNSTPEEGMDGNGDPPWPPEAQNSAQLDGYAADLRLRSELGPGCLFDEGAQLTREATAESSPPSDCLDFPLTSGDELRISGSRTFSGSNPGHVSVEEFAIHTPNGVIRPDPARSTQTVDGASVTYELVFPTAPSAGLLTYTGSTEGSGPYPAVGICYDTRTGYSEGLETCT